MICNVEIVQGRIRQTKDFSMTGAELENRLRTFSYSGENRVKDPAVENLKLPSIALSFYSLLFDTGTLPSAELLVEEYLDQECYFSYIPNNKIEVAYAGVQSVVKLDSLIARILRTYPSLVRDLHFYLLAKESKLFSAVHYSVTNDFTHGVDIRVRHNNKWYNVALFLETPRAIQFWGKKRLRHETSPIISIKLKPSEAARVGDFMLYTTAHVRYLSDIIFGDR